MAILNIQTVQAGLVGTLPSLAYIYTDSTESQVLTTGFLNHEVQNGASFQMPCMAIVSTKATPTSAFQVGLYQVAHVGANWSLVPSGSPGDVVLPTILNHIATYTNTTGQLSEDPATAISGGNIQAGLSGTAGYFASFPATLARGSLRLVGANSVGDTVTQITNASMAAARVFSIPDGGQSASNFLISDSAGTQTIATGSLALTLGNLTVAAGSIAATLGAISAGTTMTAGTGITATTGNIVASAGNLVAGATGAAGSVTSFSGTGSAEFLRLAAIDNAGGNFSTTISNASSVGQSQVISIPDVGAATGNFILSGLAAAGIQHITSGSLEVDAGSLLSGIGTGGFVGLVKAFPTTATSGFIAIQAAVNGSGNFGTTVSNATTQGQAQVITVPDSGAATANFLLDTGAANILAMQQFVGIQSVLTFGTGTWTTTRVAQGNYVKRHTAGDETSIIAIDITPQIRVAASKGFRLDSFDYMYAIATLALDAHSLTLDRIAYANNVAVSVTSVPVTGTLATATQANPYLTNVTVNTPAFDITADSKYVMEITVNNSATSAFDFYGIMLRFSQTIA